MKSAANSRLTSLFTSVFLLTALVCFARATSPSNPTPVALFAVTNTNDSGSGSLRQALQDSNNTGGTDTITFNIPGAGVHTITRNRALPAHR